MTARPWHRRMERRPVLRSRDMLKSPCGISFGFAACMCTTYKRDLLGLHAHGRLGRSSERRGSCLIQFPTGTCPFHPLPLPITLSPHPLWRCGRRAATENRLRPHVYVRRLSRQDAVSAVIVQGCTAWCTTGAPRVHHLCTTGAPRAHRLCTTGAPLAHHRCTIGQPSVHQP